MQDTTRAVREKDIFNHLVSKLENEGRQKFQRLKDEGRNAETVVYALFQCGNNARRVVRETQEMDELDIRVRVRLGHVIKTTSRHSKIGNDNPLCNLGGVPSLHRHPPEAVDLGLSWGVVEVFTVNGFCACKAAILRYLDRLSAVRGHFPDSI